MTIQGNRSFKVRNKLEISDLCGCYYCLKVYSPIEIDEWVDDEQTAICPHCGIDAVVPYIKDIDQDLINFNDNLKKWFKESFS